MLNPQNATSAISFQDVSIQFPGGVQALRGVTFSVQAGEFVSILGPSGCGKSTLLKIAAGLTEYSSGALYVDRAHLGFTFQDATLLPWRTVRENVELLLELRGVSSADRKRVAQNKIELVGLQGFENRLPKHLSSGMKMRASLARSLTLEPTIFLFDEPFGALDEITRERLNSELLNIYQKQTFTSLFVTHSIAEAVYLSSRIVVMSARPGRPIFEMGIPFPYPRDDVLRYTPEFAEICNTLSRTLRAAESEALNGAR